MSAKLMFKHSEKATKFCEISTVDLTGKFSFNFVQKMKGNVLLKA